MDSMFWVSGFRSIFLSAACNKSFLQPEPRHRIKPSILAMTLSYIWYFFTARILCKWPTIWRSSVNDRWRRFFFSKNPLRWTWRLCNVLCLWSWKYVTSRTYVSRSQQIFNIHSLKFNVLKHTKLKTTQTTKTIINKKCIKNMRNAFELRWLYRQGHRNQTQTTFNNLPIVLRLSKSNADISLIRSCIWFLSFFFLSIDLSDILGGACSLRPGRIPHRNLFRVCSSPNKILSY